MSFVKIALDKLADANAITEALSFTNDMMSHTPEPSALSKSVDAVSDLGKGIGHGIGSAVGNAYDVAKWLIPGLPAAGALGGLALGIGETRSLNKLVEKYNKLYK